MEASSLVEIIRARSAPMLPLSTGEQARLTPSLEAQAVVFDVYGTLFISGSGDISLAVEEDRSAAIQAALEAAGFTVHAADGDWSGLFLDQLKTFRQRRRAEGVAHPEVRIEEVWAALVAQARAAGWLTGDGRLELAIVDHECRVNPCWPMPGLATALESLARRGLPLGIVSNAQFYTPLLFPALTGRSCEDFCFQSDLCVWSYREREGKPSVNLYQNLHDKLLARGIAAGRVLYVGNDLRNDIWPAQQTGFKTALFAADRRSLRWRRDDAACAGVLPDYVLTDLAQLESIIG